nr:unnamed protein product [Callosobruchus chinensis]
MSVVYQCTKNHAVSAMQQILLVLRFCATGCMLQTAAYFAWVHKATTCQIIKKVIHAIASLAPEYINMPKTQQQVDQVADPSL